MTKKELVDMLAEYPLETEIEFTRLVLDPDGDYVDQVIDIVSPFGLRLDKNLVITCRIKR